MLADDDGPIIDKPVDIEKPPSGVRWHGCPPRQGCICSGTNDPEKLAYEQAWRFIDNIFCICLSDRNDRLAEAGDQFHARGLCRRVCFFRPDKPSADDMESEGVSCRGLFGIWRSHQTVAQRAVMLGSRRTLVFEDDVLFHPKRTTASAIADIGNRIAGLESSNTSYDVVYLGHVPFFSVPVAFDLGLFRTYSMMAHAYLLSISGSSKLASRNYGTNVRLCGAERGIDNWICRDFIQYAPRRQFCLQSGSRSSNLQNTAAVNDYWYDVVVPFGIEAHRDAVGAFEAFTFFLVPILAVCILVYAAQSRRRAAVLILLIAVVWITFLVL